jgi:hypothetical protein
MAWSSTPWSAKNGLGFGVVAGVVLLLAESIATWIGGRGLLEPVRYAASVVLGVRALTETPIGLALAVGLGVHLLQSAFFGLVYSLIDARMSPELRPRLEHQSAVGMLFGLGVWGLAFQFTARGYFPWFLETPQFFQLVMHAIFFGLPLGLLFAAAERRRVAIAVFERSLLKERTPQAGGESRD